MNGFPGVSPSVADVPATDELATRRAKREPFVMVPAWVVSPRLGLSDTAKCAYIAIAGHLRNGQNQTFLKRETIMADMGKKSTNPVDRAIRELEDAGVITVVRRRNGKQLANKYTVRMKPPWED
jgi:hypothetical protein